MTRGPARKSATRRRSALRKGRCDPAQCAELFKRIMPVGDGDPVEVFAWTDDHRGVIRRAEARYENGWVVRVNFNAAQKVTSHSASLKLTTKVQQ